MTNIQRGKTVQSIAICKLLSGSELRNLKWSYNLHDKAKEKYWGVFEIQKSGDKTSSGEIGLDIRTHASPKVGQDQVSGWVSVPCRHATPIADVPWIPIFSDVKFSKESNQGKCHELVVSIQGKESSSVRSQFRERVMNWLCNIWLRVSGLNKKHLQIPNGTGPGVRRSKRHLLACRTRCICSMETLYN